MGFGGGLGDNDDDALVSDINVTPLVDVMLVLLIVFMITVPVLTHAIKLDLPRVADQPQLAKPDAIELSVTADGEVHWNQQSVRLEDLLPRLKALAPRQPQPEIFIRGDRKVAYEHVVRVMAAVQQAGLVRVGFVTQPDEKGQ
ncbi:MAG: biopolymer transporter ExbD [Pseudomonas sp.]